MTKQPFGSESKYLLFLLTLSLALNLLLGVAVVREPAAAAGAPPEPKLAVGDSLPSVTGTDEAGNVVTVDLLGEPTVLYMESRTCIWCERNAANMRELFNRKRGEYRFIGLGFTADRDLAAHARSRGLEFPHLTAVSQAFANKHGFGGTPQLVVIDRNGRVLANWAGALQGDMQAEAEAFFAVSLPGLIADEDLPEAEPVRPGISPPPEPVLCRDPPGGLAYSEGATIRRGRERLTCREGSWVKGSK